MVVTLGTGIGGAVMLGGELWRGAGGMAGEFGHQQVVPGGMACQCGRSGCWERYCSGNVSCTPGRVWPPRPCSTGPAGRPRRADRSDGHRGREGRATPSLAAFAEVGRLAGCRAGQPGGRPSTPPSSSSAVVCRLRAACCSTRPAPPSPDPWWSRGPRRPAGSRRIARSRGRPGRRRLAGAADGGRSQVTDSPAGRGNLDL